MSIDSRLPVKVDVTQLTLGEMAEAIEASGGDQDSPGFNFRQMAALAWVTLRRTDPEFTFKDALELKISDIDMTEDAPEVPSGDSGVTPLPSRALNLNPLDVLVMPYGLLEEMNIILRDENRERQRQEYQAAERAKRRR